MLINTVNVRKLVFLGASLCCAAAASAAGLQIDVGGTQSFDEMGASANAVITRQIAADALISGFEWNVSLSAYGESWLQDMSLRISNSAGVGVTLVLDSAQQAGTQHYAGSADLSELGLDFRVGADGLLRLEFFESYDDAVGLADGQWNSGTLSFSGVTAAVPEPASYGLLGLGLLVIGGAARRRSRL